MKTYDEQYTEIIKNILEHGKDNNEEVIQGENYPVRTKYADGTPAYTRALLNQQITLDNRGNSVPLLYSKRQAVKDPITELYWIKILQSNSVEELQKLGSKVWDEWSKTGEGTQEKVELSNADHFIRLHNLYGIPFSGKTLYSEYVIGDGTIGKAYGFQMGSKLRKVPVNTTSKKMLFSREIKNYWKYLDINEELLLEHINSGKLTELYLNQTEYLIYMLRHDPLSRRIKTTLYHVEDNDSMALEPCVYDTHFQVLGGELHLTVNIRSNDMGLGNPYNIYQYAIWHKLISKVVGIPTGTLHFNIDNAHVYDRHIPTIREQVTRDYEVGTGAYVEITDFGTNIYNFRPEMVKVHNYTAEGKYRYETAI